MSETNNNTQMVDLIEFDNALKNHDWFYSYSDDGRVYSNGKAEEKKLLEWSKRSASHKALHEAYETANYHKQVISEGVSPRLKKTTTS